MSERLDNIKKLSGKEKDSEKVIAEIQSQYDAWKANN